MDDSAAHDHVFKTLTIENFKSFTGDPVEINLSPVDNGINYVLGHNAHNERMGANGVGKSSIWDALSWCLTGKTVKGLPTTAIVPWSKSKGGTTVTLVMEIGEESFEIRRTTSPSRVTVNDTTYGQEDLDELVFSYEILTQAVVLGQDRPLFLDRTPGDKMKLLSEVLRLDRWEHRSSEARGRVSKYQKREANLTGEVEGLQLAVENAEEALKDAKREMSAWNKERESRVDEVASNLEDVRTSLTSVEDKVNEVDLEAARIGTELKVDGPEHKKRKDELDELKDSNLKLHSDYSSCERERERIEEEIVEMRSAKKCPTCGQSVKPANLKKHLSKLESSLEATLEEEEDLRIQVEESDKKVEALRKKINNDDERISELEDELRKAERLGRSHAERLSELKTEERSLSNKLKESEDEDNPHAQSVQKARRTLKRSKADLSEAEKDLKRARRSRVRNEFWAKGFRDIRLGVINEVLNEMNVVTNSMLVEVGMEGWSVEYTTERETKSGTTQRNLAAEVQSPTSPESVRWESWSGGESQRLRIVSALALSEVLLRYAGVSPNIMVLDEPAKYLSREGVDDLQELLSLYAESASLNLWYIDHQAVETAHADSVVTVVNDGGVSRIETG